MYGRTSQPYTVSCRCPGCNRYSLVSAYIETPNVNFFSSGLGINFICRVLEAAGSRICAECKLPYVATHVEYGGGL